MSTILIWSLLRWRNRFAALGDHDSGSAAQGAPSAGTVRQRRRLVLVLDPLAEGDQADTESLPGAASEVETVEVPERTVDSDPIPMERRLRAAPGHSPVWTQLISTKFSNCGQE